jgi:hypothetical protein
MRTWIYLERDAEEQKDRRAEGQKSRRTEEKKDKREDDQPQMKTIYADESEFVAD